MSEQRLKQFRDDAIEVGQALQKAGQYLTLMALIPLTAAAVATVVLWRCEREDFEDRE